MPSGKNIMKYHVTATAAINNRRELQQAKQPTWKFQFPANNAEARLSDRVEVRGVKLHAGFNITVIMEGAYSDDVVDIGTSLVDRIVDKISLITVSHCDIPRLLSHITINDDGTSKGIFYHHQDLDTDNIIILGTPRKIDEKIFQELWGACDGHKHEDRIERSLAWFRKALSEHYIIDQFISFFVAIEVINPILRDILKHKMRRPKKWDGIKDIFNNKIKSVDFEKVKLARNQILHGYKTLPPEFITEIRSYIAPTRKAVIYGIGRILGLPDAPMDAIASNDPRKLFIRSSIGLKGSFKNLPTETEELLKDYPEITPARKPNLYSIRDTGELDITFSTDFKAKLPEGTIFSVDTMTLTGEKDAGLTPGKAELHDKKSQ